MEPGSPSSPAQTISAADQPAPDSGPPVVNLDATTLIPTRPFTDPALSLQDLRALHRCVGRLRAAIHSSLLCGDETLCRFEWEDDAGLHQRIVARRGVDLLAIAPLTVVGFFGQRRRMVDRGPIEDVDAALVAEIADHADVLAYYTSALLGGEYANLVLCANDGARTHWNRSPRHAWAVRELAPACYHSVRLHNGVMAHGLRCSAGPVLTRTKYYDYDGPSVWRAVRTFSPPLALT